MKKVINNKLYNTDTAKKLGTWENTRDYRDPGCISESLYQKRTGEYFLYGEGGPMSKYARSTSQNNWSGGEMIMPLTVDIAREWVEEHLDTDKYVEIFGEPGEDDALENLYVQLPADLMARIRRYATEHKTSLRAVVEQAARTYIEA